ncbi:hypothetical protein BCC0238_002903 [Burkholderia gladioli]
MSAMEHIPTLLYPDHLLLIGTPVFMPAYLTSIRQIIKLAVTKRRCQLSVTYLKPVTPQLNQQIQRGINNLLRRITRTKSCTEFIFPANQHFLVKCIHFFPNQISLLHPLLQISRYAKLVCRVIDSELFVRLGNIPNLKKTPDEFLRKNIAGQLRGELLENQLLGSPVIKNTAIPPHKIIKANQYFFTFLNGDKIISPNIRVQTSKHSIDFIRVDELLKKRPLYTANYVIQLKFDVNVTKKLRQYVNL